MSNLTTADLDLVVWLWPCRESRLTWETAAGQNILSLIKADSKAIARTSEHLPNKHAELEAAWKEPWKQSYRCQFHVAKTSF